MKPTRLIAWLCLLGAACWLSWLAIPSDTPPSSQPSSGHGSMAGSEKPASPALANLREKLGAGRSSAGDASGHIVADAVQRLRNALNGGDDDEIESAFQSLAGLLEEKPERINEVFAIFEADVDPRLTDGLARLILPHFSRENTGLFARALAVAQNGEPPEKRGAALRLLSSVRDPEPELLDFMFRISREDSVATVRLRAVQVIGQWAEDSRQWDHLSGELVRTIDSSSDNEVRGYAIQVIALYSGITRDEVLGDMAAYLKEDPSPQNRALAALAIGRVPEELRASALDHLGEAFAGEPIIDTRRNILAQIARAGRQQAIAVLQSLPASHPILIQDIRDYIEILQDGEVEGDEIYNRKFARDVERGTIVGAYGYYDPASPQSTP